MKKRFLFVFFACAYSQIWAEGIQFFKGTWKEALAFAQKEKKVIFVDAYAVWCGPCKFMEKKVFSQKEVADYYNKNFVCYKLDVDVETALAQRFGVEAMPTLLFVDTQENILRKKVGMTEAEEFLQLGREVCQIPAMQARYEKGERGKAFMMEYLKIMQENKTEQVLKAAKEYFATLQDEELLEKENFELMTIYTHEVESREFRYFYSHKSAFYEKYGENSQAIIINAYQTLYKKAIENQEIDYVKQISSLVNNAFPIIDKAKAESIVQRTYMDFYKQIKQYGKYMELARSYVEKYAQFDEETLVGVAYDFYTMSDKKEDLELAEKWTRRALQAGDSYEVLHFLAEILAKAGKKAEAIKECKKAISYAKANQIEDYSKSEVLLKQLEQR
ncbi:MAG: thioredoxin domain-containing protein [Microscillaceae bacterium]|nr:thioredoxin domain-containing protein [Microscillaceae bacterium]MDW8460965.1 thioredoxin domain-containing protein [Cytophagales bacterium]